MKKSRLSPTERLEYYEKAMREFRTHKYGPWLCIVLKFSVFGTQSAQELIEFPELAAQRPPDRSEKGMWWYNDDEGNISRENALKACIELVKKEIEKELTLIPLNGPDQNNS